MVPRLLVLINSLFHFPPDEINLHNDTTQRELKKVIYSSQAGGSGRPPAIKTHLQTLIKKYYFIFHSHTGHNGG